MATLDADSVVIAGTATIYVAPTGTTLPESLSDTLDPAFVEVGYTTNDGVQFSDTKTVESVMAHQAFYAIRKFITERASSATFSMLQWDADSVPLAFGGGVITEPEPGEFRYTPPDPADIDERSLVIDLRDGERNFRFSIRKGMVTSNTDTTFARTGAALLPITFEVLGEDDETPWTLDSDDPAWAPAGS